MSAFKVDLSNCDKEPIHISGAIQSWGFLVVVNSSTNIISYVSANILDYLNISPGAILGQKLSALEELLSQGNTNKIPLTSFAEASKKKQGQSEDSYYVELGEQQFNLLIHVNKNNVHLEFELKSDSGPVDIHNQIGRAVSIILAATELPDILKKASSVIKELIQYDRVMIYEFMEDAHGKVVAESKNPELEPFLDLHYPASDIPAQARRLYKINKSRIIADAHSETSAILSLDDIPLDLTHSVLRSVSPMHIQYLKNMGVASSFSVSIICGGKLWGLISCHNYTPRFINHRTREGAKLLGQIISSSIEYKEEERLIHEQQQHKAVLDYIIEQFRLEKEIEDAVIHHQNSFKNIVKAGGAVLIFEGKMIKDGNTPSDEQILSIVKWLSTRQHDRSFETNKLVDFISEAEEYKNIASGILACTISKELNEYVIWFRPEYIQNVYWAGNPEKPVEYSANGEWNISPRKSFESFIQIVKNTSETWKVYEHNLALRFRDEILYIINKKTSEIRILNEKLKDAYEELETFSSTISHDLRTPLAVIKNYAQLIERNKTLDNDGKKFATRINFGVEKMNKLITEVLEYSKVGRSEIRFDPIDMEQLLESIKSELLIALNPSDLTLIIENPLPIAGDKIMIYQVFLNLINNAIKYSRLSKPSIVRVSATENEYEVIYSVKDNGIGISEEHYHKVFELFKRVNVQQEFEGTGVGLAIVKRIIDKHKAKIWIESKIKEGTTFFLKFRKHNAFNQ